MRTANKFIFSSVAQTVPKKSLDIVRLVERLPCLTPPWTRYHKGQKKLTCWKTKVTACPVGFISFSKYFCTNGYFEQLELKSFSNCGFKTS